MSDFTRTHFTAADWSEWLTFHDEHVKRPNYYLTDRHYFDWTFLHNPYNPTPHMHQFSLWRHDGAIVGYIGRIWSRLHLGDGATEACLWQEASYVRSDMRGLGLGTQLYAWVAGSEATGNIQGVKQPQVDRVLQKTLGPPARRECMKRAVLCTFQHVGTYWPLVRTTEASGGPITLHDMAAWASALWERAAPRYGVSTMRTKAWLRWRFLDHPRAITYRLIATDAAVAIVRIERAHLHNVVRIVDLWGVQVQDVEEVLRAVIGYAEGVRATAVDFLCAGWPDREAFDALGFAMWEGVQMNQLPMLFNPLDTTVREEQVTLYGVPRTGPWYVTRADDGRDRP